MDNIQRVVELEIKRADDKIKQKLLKAKRENQQDLINSQISIMTNINKQIVMAAFFGGSNG